MTAHDLIGTVGSLLIFLAVSKTDNSSDNCDLKLTGKESTDYYPQ